MKKLYFPNFLLILLVLTFSLAVRAQEDQINNQPDNEMKRRVDKRPNVLRELGLSREQMQAIRRLNGERKLQMQEAQRKLADARKNLDMAIYADAVNDSEVQARLKEFQNAQAEAAAIRLNTEYGIRKILTPEQVVRFRQLRQRFAAMREDFQNRPKNQPSNNPVNRPNRLLNRQNRIFSGDKN